MWRRVALDELEYWFVGDVRSECDAGRIGCIIINSA